MYCLCYIPTRINKNIAPKGILALPIYIARLLLHLLYSSVSCKQYFNIVHCIMYIVQLYIFYIVYINSVNKNTVSDHCAQNHRAQKISVYIRTCKLRVLQFKFCKQK